VDERLPAALTEVRSLLDLTRGAELPPRAVVEDTLTSGYAYALELERQRLRIEARLRALVRSERRGPADEVARLIGSLAEADRELASVRALLSSLRRHALA
jgi:hypothetical protein